MVFLHGSEHTIKPSLTQEALVVTGVNNLYFPISGGSLSLVFRIELDMSANYGRELRGQETVHRSRNIALFPTEQNR